MSADLTALGGGQPKEPFCPLCLVAFDFASPGHCPTAEHVIQACLGGTLATATLTCRTCNSNNGSQWQGHLVKAMQACDFLDGVGSVPGVIHNDIGHVAINLDWNHAAPVSINVVGEKASNMSAVAALPQDSPRG